ncbi:MAG: TetR/AcrR family transcriptional regulator [Thermodesulfobacteriota bacterium]
MINNAERSNIEPEARKRLLEAATALFAERGYAGTSVQGIVVRAGVSKPVLYYYFKSKAGIFRAILDRAAQMQEDLLAEIMETPGTALDRFILIYRSIYEGVAEYPDLFRLIHNLLFGPPDAVPSYDLMGFHRRMLNAIQIIYGEGVSRREVIETESDEVAMLVMGLLDLCFHHDQLLGGVPDPERPERLLRLAFRGLSARAE